MSVDCIKKDGKLLCSFNGRMGLQATMETEPIVLDDAKGVQSITFNLSGVKYISSSFLKLCLLAAKAVNGNFKIIGASDNVFKIFRIAGMIKILNVYHDSE